MNRNLCLIILLMLLTSIDAMSQTSLLMDTPDLGTKPLKILSWNIYMLPYISLFNHNADRARVIADKLEFSDYQIIVFQEAFSSKCRNILAKRLAKEYPYQYGPANKCYWPFRTSSGLWVVSKMPLKQLAKIKFTEGSGFDIIARKGAVLFQGDFEGTRFQLLATHLQADNSEKIRAKQCREIKEHLLNEFYNPNIPQLICGDFNIEMDDRVNYQRMLSTLEANNGLISGEVKCTYDEIDNNLARNAQGEKKVIDYILVRNEQLIHRIERKVHTFYARIGEKSSNLSDHYAMEANIVFNTVPTAVSSLLLTDRK
ncbi:Endonuclease/exonuclease/phosphatase [Paludibacter propionicigenes WB4]|uniref:Endonuclease/exonuclease/phosphatase n=1 Tax=Paludibacter propionicigenes (strain DSM 17365 / JCM 13257 / WB4) TaxID=694427 RepID=E4T437_PALPW|nr:sphingomyelin phosphodiesterase [Paludibacter propionicigenes]ADQ79481.1 Endonuclease/exonuclease/phosphatase [Paludibacter propionicigenes WB4]